MKYHIIFSLKIKFQKQVFKIIVLHFFQIFVKFLLNKANRILSFQPEYYTIKTDIIWWYLLPKFMALKNNQIKIDIINHYLLPNSTVLEFCCEKHEYVATQKISTLQHYFKSIYGVSTFLLCIFTLACSLDDIDLTRFAQCQKCFVTPTVRMICLGFYGI